jgi:DNA-binding NtrC family response regulator
LDILLVSNQAASSETQLIRQVSSELGVGLQSATNYKDGIEALAKHNFSIVILYCFTATGDFEATQAVRLMKEIMPSLLLIVISQDTTIEEERELRQSGLYFHLTSPVEKQELRAVLSGAIEKERTRRRL